MLTARLRHARKLPPKAHAISLNIPLIMLLVDELGYPRKHLSRDLVYGMGIVGGIETTNSLATMDIPDTTNLGRVENSLSERNRPILKALDMANNMPLKESDGASRSMNSTRGGSMDRYPCLSLVGITLPSPPAILYGGKHGKQEPKFRLIDDLTKSLVNGTVESSGTYFPKDLDSIVAIARVQASYGADQLRARSSDFPHAYKTIALRP